MTFPKYGQQWHEGTSNAQIERWVLQRGGKPLGLFQHFKNYWSALWPEDSHNRWTELMLKEVLENQFTFIMGPGSSWKSSTIAKIAVMDWSLFPECTMVLVSSTTIKELKQRIFSEISKVWESANNRYGGEDGWWPGNPIDYLCAITNESLEQEEDKRKKVRDLRNAIIGVPCVADGKWQGMSKMAGKKNRRVWCLSDEYQFMERAVCDVQENLISNGPNLVPGYYPEDHPDITERKLPRRGYKAVFIGNANNTRPDNPLHLVMAPYGGWGTFEFDGTTKVYDCPRVPGTVIQGRGIILDGLDSPNNDYPYDSPRWTHLISKKRIDMYSPESEGYYSQGRGIVKLGLAGLKIITVEMCQQFHAFDTEIMWDGETTKIGMLDAAYGGVGGDRCVVGFLEFGKCIDGKVRMYVNLMTEVPIKINPRKIPEDQIAEFCKDFMERVKVPPQNFFFDGRGKLAMSFARIWSSAVNVVDFGGRPSDRIAGPDIFAEDRETKMRRPKLAHEHFSKLVSELWWSVVYVVQSDQMRGLTIPVVMDGQPREYYKVKSDKIEIETKEEMKKRSGCSPDYFDALVVGVEGARRRGFQIVSLVPPSNKKKRQDPLAKLAQEWQELQEQKLAAAA